MNGLCYLHQNPENFHSIMWVIRKICADRWIFAVQKMYILQKQLEFFLKSTAFFFVWPCSVCSSQECVYLKTMFKSNLMRNFAQNSPQLNWYGMLMLSVSTCSLHTYKIIHAQNIFSNEKRIKFIAFKKSRDGFEIKFSQN